MQYHVQPVTGDNHIYAFAARLRARNLEMKNETQVLWLRLKMTRNVQGCQRFRVSRSRPKLTVSAYILRARCLLGLEDQAVPSEMLIALQIMQQTGFDLDDKIITSYLINMTPWCTSFLAANEGKHGSLLALRPMRSTLP